MPAKNIDEYIASFPDEVQQILQNIRSLIKDTATKSTEAIAYGIPTFRLNGKNLVHFAGYSKHIGLYPMASGVENFQDEIGQYKTSKGAIQFPLNKPIPYKLIEKIVKWRMKNM